MEHKPLQNDTICAIATPSGTGAIAMIRVSGEDAIRAVEKNFSKSLSDKPSHTAHYGNITKNGEILDEVVAIVYKNPHSFTGENMVEITCHASPYIRQQLLALLVENGCRIANPGEFSLRAYLNGKLDLSQAEAIADLIAAENRAAHRMAITQVKGGFAKIIGAMRDKLIHFASMIELELDFGEEDVEFADRQELRQLVTELRDEISRLTDSYALGNILKHGVPVTIAGAPNVGKSTLLNELLNEERAIVSDIAGTTRDVIEDTIHIDGIEFRFIDTAGLRDTSDTIEKMGIERTHTKMREAVIVLYLIDPLHSTPEKATAEVEAVKQKTDPAAKLIVLLNKADLLTGETARQFSAFAATFNAISISAKTAEGIDELKAALTGFVSENRHVTSDIIVSNARHQAALTKAREALDRVLNGLETGLPSDLVAMDIRQCMFHLAEITGTISTDDLLDNIFSNFCIGK